MTLYLSTGYEVELEDPDSLEHLTAAIVGETATQFDREGIEYEFERFWTHCSCELHYVAGQLKTAGSALTLDRLKQEFLPYFCECVADVHGKDFLPADFKPFS